MLRRWAAWWGALTVSVITAGLVVLDIGDGSVHRYWSEHAFTASVLSGVLVLLVTVLIIDRGPRRFLEAAQRVAGELYRSLDATGAETVAKARLEEAVQQLKAAAAPLLDALDSEQRAAITAQMLSSRSGAPPAA